MACAIPTQTLTHIASRSVSGWQRQLPLSLYEMAAKMVEK